MNLHQLEQISQRPQDFLVLERVPLTCNDMKMPLVLDCPAGDEVKIVILDVESTGFDPKVNALTELGLTSVLYSPSLGKITSIEATGSWYQDPLHPIPEFIQGLTGIIDSDVQGKKIQPDDIQGYFTGDPILIAHNAGFDRPFCEKYINEFPTNLRWACSVNQIDWNAAKIESKKLAFVLFKLGFFYDGHRANTDTLALLFVFMQRPELLNELVLNSSKRSAVIRAINSPFNAKDLLKTKGFKWCEDGVLPKHWYLNCEEKDVDQHLSFLSGIYSAKEYAQIEYLDARTRFKGV